MALGSNVPPRGETIREALARIGDLPATEVTGCSMVYETEPEGGPPQGPFLNAAAVLATGLAPRELLRGLEGIERELGRRTKGGKRPRTIDLDIIFHGDRVLESEDLVLPHPRFRERGFVLQPLADIIPGFRDPRTNRTVRGLLETWIRDGGRCATGVPLVHAE